MQPQNRTLHIPRPPMQSIPIPQINRRHPNPPPALIPAIIRRDLTDPVVPHIRATIRSKPDIDQEIGILFAGREVGCWSGAAEFFGDGFGQERRGLPAA